ncbi:MAG: hypothetical protein ACRDGA_02585, partial [Bacteroidota bacterium]
TRGGSNPSMPTKRLRDGETHGGSTPHLPTDEVVGIRKDMRVPCPPHQIFEGRRGVSPAALIVVGWGNPCPTNFELRSSSVGIRYQLFKLKEPLKWTFT